LIVVISLSVWSFLRWLKEDGMGEPTVRKKDN